MGQRIRSLGLLTCLGAVLLLAGATHAAQDAISGVAENISVAAESAKTSIEEAGTVAADKIERIWHKIDERRLRNRTRDEIVAWAIMGLLAGACAGLVSVLKASAAQRLGAVALGLLGAFIGGILAHVAELDFGMGPVLIRYEDLLLSLMGGLVLIGAVRLIKARRSGKV